ncbi:MAG TPA: hypothetical protein DEA08_27040 [Planctomycetes bacterium]|nr:hypothetical protein [Planctomycetota bacterium]
MNTIAETSQHQVLSGASAACQSVNEMIDLVAALPTTVLIHGESGTGKERVARGLHEGSDRAQGPFVAINCAALSGALLESELFGYEQGAFTGARAGGKRGLFEAANGGTLFLDEVGELPLEIQPQLLRFIETGEIRPIGQNRSMRVDTRVIAATNRDLRAMIKEGRFREDLYYRLNVLPVEIPALRERLEDLPELAGHFLRRFARRFGRPVEAISKKAMLVLKSYEWPGNVRELENVMERAVMLCRGKELRPEHLFMPGSGDLEEASAPTGEGSGVGDPIPLAELERLHILAVLKGLGGNQKRASGVLGISKSTLWRKLKEYGIDASKLASSS